MDQVTHASTSMRTSLTCMPNPSSQHVPKVLALERHLSKLASWSWAFIPTSKSGYSWVSLYLTVPDAGRHLREV